MAIIKDPSCQHLWLISIFYLDPGSGSFIIQLIIAGILSTLVFFRSFWLKLIRKIYHPKGEQEDPDDDEAD